MSKNTRIVAGLGAALIALNVLAIPIWLFPLPIKVSPGFKSLASNAASAPEFIKKGSGIGEMKEDRISRRLLYASRIDWLKNFAFIGVEILLGVLLLKFSRLGRFLALGWFGWFIIMRVMIISSFGLTKYLSIHSFSFERNPIPTVLEHLNISIALIGFVILITPWGGAVFRRSME